MRIQPITSPSRVNIKSRTKHNTNMYNSAYQLLQPDSRFIQTPISKKIVDSSFSFPFNDIYLKPVFKSAYIQNSYEKHYPVSFSKSRKFSTDKKRIAEKSGNFYICRYDGTPCPACGKKMMNLSKFKQISQELSELQPEEYLDYLGQYKEYMRPVEESVFNEIYENSKKPGASKDIRTLLVELRDEKMPILQKVQMRQVKKMRALAKTLPEKEKKVLMSKVNELSRMIRKNNASAPFRRKVMIDRISKVKIENQKKYEKLQNIARSFPTSADMNSAWIVKYSGKNKLNIDWDSYSIALRFLASSIANTDHILAYDIENNHDDISNYMAMHNACNTQKSNKPFLQWLNEDKENRIKYMEDYFNYVNDLLESGKIKKKKYKNYVAYATETIFEVSKGQVKLFDSDN